MQRKYSYIVNKPKGLLCGSDKNISSNLGSDLNEINEIKFNDDFYELLKKADSCSYQNQHEYYNVDVICKCGHHFKDKNLSLIFHLTHEEYISFDKKNDTRCPKCNLKIDILNSIKIEKSYNSQNVFRKKYHIFEENEKVKIVLFTDKVQYNKSGKIFIQKDRKSITFNVKDKTFFYSGIYNNLKIKRIIGISNTNFNHVFLNFFKESYDNKICFDRKNTQNIFRNYNLDVIEPFNRFMNILIKNLEQKDVSRIMTYIKFINYNDFDFYFRDYDHTFSCNKLNKSEFEIRQKNNEIKNNEILKDYINNISIISSIVQYPYNCNILFNKGKDFFIEILKEKGLPNSSYLKEKKPTSPTNIFIEAFNYKTVRKLCYNKKVLKSIIKENYYPNLILNNNNIKKLKKWNKENLINTSCSTFPISVSTSIMSHILEVERLKVNLNENKNNLFLPKIALNKISSWVDLTFFISMSKYLNKEHMLYICNKFDLNEFIFILKRMECVYYEEDVKEKTFNNFEDKIKIIHFILKIKEKGVLNLKEFPFNILTDSFNFLERIYENEKDKHIKEIFKCNNISQLRDLHDSLYEKVLLKQNKDHDEKIRNFCENYKEINTNIIENVSFKLIDNVEDLLEEGSYMKHCVGTYAFGLAQGKHLIFSVKDLDTEERATLEFYKINNEKNPFDTNSVVWVFSQLKSKYNQKASENIINKFKIFYKKLEKSGLKIKVDNNSYDLLAGEK